MLKIHIDVYCMKPKTSGKVLFSWRLGGSRLTCWVSQKEGEDFLTEMSLPSTRAYGSYTPYSKIPPDTITPEYFTSLRKPSPSTAGKVFTFYAVREDKPAKPAMRKKTKRRK